MKILIDAHMVGGRESGNEHYILGLLAGLQSVMPQAEVIVATSDPDALNGVLSICHPWRLVCVSRSPFRRLFVELPYLVSCERVDLLHVTYSGPLHCRCPVVVSVHDVSYLRHPEWFSWRDRTVLRAGVGLTLPRACGVIAISEHARGEIQAHYNLPPSRIAVTPLAARQDYQPVSPSRVLDDLGALGIGQPYFLAVGNLQPRKNLPRLIEAFAKLKRDTNTPLRLVIAGRAKWRESEVFAAISRHHLSADVLFPGYVTDAQLVSLYCGSVAFIYPSLYEGFGLPIIEAMACGVPVITSSTSAMPETAGVAALIVNPYDVEAMAGAMARIMQDGALRIELGRKGIERAKQFSWERTASQTLDAYHRWLT
ncbi:MAG: glycosyltransferase family 1 protein [bacterium]